MDEHVGRLERLVSSSDAVCGRGALASDVVEQGELWPSAITSRSAVADLATR